MNTFCKPATQKAWTLQPSISRVFKLKCTTRSSRLQWRSSPSEKKCSISSCYELLGRNNAAFGQTQRRNFHSTSSKNKDGKARPDPFARRPTAKCDPYGQGGKPLPLWEANTLLTTLDPQWKIEEADTTKQTTDDDENAPLPPQALTREFVHPDFISGSKFVAKIAAVAQLNIHYPCIQLERRIVPKKKEWQVITRVRCHTLVLGGLSSHDFHLAMVSLFSIRSLQWHYFLQKSTSQQVFFVLLSLWTSRLNDLKQKRYLSKNSSRL